MKRTHAAIQLLRLEPLNSREFVAITGWPYKSAMKVLENLRRRGVIKNLMPTPEGYSVYALRTGDYL